MSVIGSASGSSALSQHTDSRPVTRSLKKRRCQTPECRQYVSAYDSHSLCLRCLGVDHDHANCQSCQSFESRNLALRLSAVQHFRDTGEWIRHPCSRARKQALSKARSEPVAQKAKPKSPPAGSKDKSSAVEELPLSSGTLPASQDSQSTDLPVDEEAYNMTQGKFDRWSFDQPRSNADPVAFYYKPEFYALSLDFPYLPEARLVEVFQYLVLQYYRNKETAHWSCLGNALDSLCEDLMADTDECARIIPEALEAEDDGRGGGSGFTSSDLPLDGSASHPERVPSEEFSYQGNEEDEDVEDDPLSGRSPPKVEPRRPVKRPAPTTSDSASKAKSSRPSESPSTREKVDALASMFSAFMEKYERDRTGVSAPFKAPFPTPSVVSPLPSAAPSANPQDDLVSSVSKAVPLLTDEDKRVRELKAEWLDLALPRCGLPPPPPKGPRRKDVFGSNLKQVRRDLVPLHSEVLKLCQTNITEHFERLHEGERKVKEHAKRIPTFYQAPEPENKAYMLNAAVPSVLLDYLPETVKEGLKCGSADQHARLNANSALGRQEAEALKLSTRARLGVQISNALTIDLLAIQDILQNLSASVTQFVDSSPAVPTRLEDFSVWREHVRNFTTSVQRSVSELERGARDALLVLKDEINLHSQDIIKGHSDRRKAWLSLSAISESVQKEINSLPFEFFKKGDTSPPDLLGSRGTARLAAYQVVKTKVDKRAAYQVPSRPSQTQNKPRGRKNRRGRGKRSSDSLEPVSPLPQGGFDPDSNFPAPPPFRGHGRGRAGGRPRRARGGRGQPSGRRGGQ